MKKIKKVKDHWGQDVIYVQKCTRFENEYGEKAESLHNNIIKRLGVIIDKDEDYS